MMQQLPPEQYAKAQVEFSETLDALEIRILSTMEQLQFMIHQWNRVQGFWASQPNFGEKIALVHSELSEALEGNRTAAESDKIPGFRSEEEELADALIRILDMAGGFNLALGSAFVSKLRVNLRRPHKHGKAY